MIMASHNYLLSNFCTFVQEKKFLFKIIGGAEAPPAPPPPPGSAVPALCNVPEA